MARGIGYVLGREVRETKDNYIFGCGAVRLPKTTVRNFVKELNRAKTKPEQDFKKVFSILMQYGYIDRKGNLSKDRIREVNKVFGPKRPAKKQ